jgi:hypothetical protein
MTRTARLLLPALLLPALLAGCGTEQAGPGTRPSTSPAYDRAELDARVRSSGSAPELVRVTEVPGFTLARQSVGVYGDDGFSAVYWSEKSGAQIRLSVDRGTVTAADCARQPVGDVADEPVTCARDGAAWYRKGPAQHEYALAGKGIVVKVTADVAAVDRRVLRAAAKAVHRPDDAELAAALPPERSGAATEPVERGDLPSEGDGAPNNEVGTSG